MGGAIAGALVRAGHFVSGFDVDARAVERFRAAGGAAKSAAAAVAAESDAVLSVLRSALAEERQRTTDLRNELDAARIALALQHEQLEKLRGERDLWANRAQLLANAMSQEAQTVPDASPLYVARALGTDRHDRSVPLKAVV